MSAVRADQLVDVVRLRAEADAYARESQARERQLHRYAADLRETFIEERARTQELRDSYVATVRALTNAVEARDAYTGSHAERVTAYGLALALEIDPKLAADPQVEFGFLLHVIDKVAVPDGILHKQAPLTEDERRLIEEHPDTGCRILRHVDYLTGAKSVIRSHHERWDGTGYPDGLRGEEVPLAARIFAISDALDAIMTDRPYRRGVPLAAARSEIVRCAGKQFDPMVIEAFQRIPDAELELIRQEIE